MSMNQKIMVAYLKSTYGDGAVITIREDDDPGGKIVFRGTVKELEQRWATAPAN